jgi:hypothetical protein
MVNQGLLNEDNVSVIAARKENVFCDYLMLELTGNNCNITPLAVWMH